MYRGRECTAADRVAILLRPDVAAVDTRAARSFTLLRRRREHTAVDRGATLLRQSTRRFGSGHIRIKVALSLVQIGAKRRIAGTSRGNDNGGNIRAGAGLSPMSNFADRRVVRTFRDGCDGTADGRVLNRKGTCATGQGVHASEFILFGATWVGGWAAASEE